MVNIIKEQAFISAIIYLHNAAEKVEPALDLLWNALDAKFESFEILLIDDGSWDNTREKVAEFSRSKGDKKITLITLSKKHGLEAAMQVGVDFSIGDFVIELDSPQFNFDVSAIYALYEKCCEGYDIVSLEPENNKKISSNLFYKILSGQAEVGVTMNTQIAHILTRRAINAISKIKDKTSYRKLLHHFVGYKHASIPVRIEGKIESSYGFLEKLQMSSDVLFYFTNLGMRLNIYIAALFSFISLVLGGYAVYMYLYKSVIEGWPTLMLFLSFGFTGVFIVLSIISKYLSIVLKEIASLPHYTVKNIEKF